MRVLLILRTIFWSYEKLTFVRRSFDFILFPSNHYSSDDEFIDTFLFYLLGIAPSLSFRRDSNLELIKRRKEWPKKDFSFISLQNLVAETNLLAWAKCISQSVLSILWTPAFDLHKRTRIEEGLVQADAEFNAFPFDFELCKNSNFEQSFFRFHRLYRPARYKIMYYTCICICILLCLHSHNESAYKPWH